MEKIGVKRVLGFLPPAMSLEIKSILFGRLGGDEELGEIRLISGGKCSMIHKRETLFLSYSPSEEEMEEILVKICSGGVYAYRDTIKNGYIPMGDGVRVGVAGTARYDEGRLVGISRVSSMIFRFPLFHCDFGEEILKIYRRGIGRGMLIYSPPAVGKTTALRTLAEAISGEKRLCIIDERGEFSCAGLPSAVVLSGYGKALGIEIALRTHSPEIIMVDELSSTEASALTGVLGAGIPIIATAHGGRVEDLLSRASTRPLILAEFFDVFVGISYGAKGYKLKRTPLSRVKELVGVGEA